MKRQSIMSFGSLAVLGMAAAVAGIGGGGKQTDVVPAPLRDLNPVGPLAMCFAPDADPEMVGEVQRRLAELWAGDTQGFNNGNRWTGAQGNPRNIRWSIPADGLTIPTGIGEPSRANAINAFLAQAFGSVEAGKNLIRQALNDWGDQTGITYQEVSDDGAAFPNAPGSGSRGDIRIVAKNFGGAWAGVLAYNFFPQTGDMVINTFHEPDFDNPSSNFRFFRNTVCHENGHGIGIFHVCSNRAFLMEPFIQTRFDMVQHDDLQGGQRHYGDDFENNNSTGQAAFIGTVNGTGSLGLVDVSIDDNADLDYYSFTVDANKQVTLTATPVGFTYGDWDQQQNGQCPNSGPTRNSIMQHDLVLRLIDTNGSTILATSNTSGEGVAEVMGPISLPGAGTYFVRVSGDSTNDIQIYNLDVNVAEGDGFATIDAFVMVEGTVLSGDTPEIRSSDNQYVRTRSGFGNSFVDLHNMTAHVFASTNAANPATLNVSIEERISEPAGISQLSLLNWNTFDFDSIGSFALNQSDTVHVVNGVNAADYVDVSGVIVVQAKHIVFVPFVAFTFESFIDHVQIEVQ